MAGDPETRPSLWDSDGRRVALEADGMAFEVVSRGIPKARPTSTTTAMEITPLEIEATGDWACPLGTYTKDQVADSQDMHLLGTFMTILKRSRDGSWKLDRDIFNESPSEQ